ncbi:MAG TPA: prepilin-type N-terminal cleavage/methylation domain-containing protein [Candidatus Elarobacter sp.]|jgi:prepilin-type N-terminal cleavage/methylation domain-containing protein|nr:prepilin-type N-terminal cleavage/methylation domain-containing protein [Candidatus Elarobacter sp.]
MRTAERGFTLLELLVCAGLLTVALACTAGAFAALARNAAPAVARDAALSAAENALARARAAIAYAPPGGAGANGRTWALAAGTTQSTAGAELHAPAMCGANAPQVVQLPMSATYGAASERFTVVVTYPRDPCAVNADGTIPASDAATVALSEVLPPSVYAPGTPVYRDVATPARM